MIFHQDFATQCQISFQSALRNLAKYSHNAWCRCVGNVDTADSPLPTFLILTGLSWLSDWKRQFYGSYWNSYSYFTLTINKNACFSLSCERQWTTAFLYNCRGGNFEILQWNPSSRSLAARYNPRLSLACQLAHSKQRWIRGENGREARQCRGEATILVCLYLNRFDYDQKHTMLFMYKR